MDRHDPRLVVLEYLRAVLRPVRPVLPLASLDLDLNLDLLCSEVDVIPRQRPHLARAKPAEGAEGVRSLGSGHARTAMAEAPSAMPGHASLKAKTAPDATPPSPRTRRVRPKPAVITKSEAPPAVGPDEERRTVEREQERRAAELEQERPTAELARLRAILRPTVPVPPSPSVIASPPPPAPEEDGSLQALEDHIRDRIPSLPSLSVARYTAQIAAWVGRVRLIQSGPDGDRTRIASRIMFDKLRNLAWSMEAGTIEGLNLSWSTRNWERYIRDNELIASTPDPTPEPDAEADVWSTPGEADAQA